MKRRQFLHGLSGWAIAGAVAPLNELRAERVMPSSACRPTLRQTPGPYPLTDSPDRSDVTGDREGVPLRLTLNVLSDYHCRPIEGARVDIWHSDADGLYSGVSNQQFDLETLEVTGDAIDTTGASFLRGHQMTDAAGRVEFTTIIPGWYPGRMAHIHVQTVIPGLEWTSHSTQLYLPSEVERGVFDSGPYRKRGQNPIGLDRDLVLRGDAAALDQLTLRLREDGVGYRGAYDLAISF